ncbi:MAG: anhydro-N-acetylmuramic acid kinase, partial [Planctomycetes bacterium]|nr:anhydro-N-acetylmuramic acid kinase [Planctomycetota bacterium]
MKKLAKLRTTRSVRVAGLMSGTSADGVDAAIVEITGRRVKILAFKTYPYCASLQKAIMKASYPETARLDDICHLNFAIGETFARALVNLAARGAIPLSSIDLVGSHGQTICHIPNGRRFGRHRIRSTLQIGEPCVIAERTGITTVADFRPRDIAAGGEGAPLVPYADYVLFSHKHLTRAVQNIGGIANVTFLPGGCDPCDIIAFDTGPGNMIIDDFVRRATNGRKRFDRGGKLAASGNVDAGLLSE